MTSRLTALYLCRAFGTCPYLVIFNGMDIRYHVLQKLFRFVANAV